MKFASASSLVDLRTTLSAPTPMGSSRVGVRWSSRQNIEHKMVQSERSDSYHRVLAPMLWGLSDVYTSTFVGWSSVHKFAESSSICDPHVLALRVLSSIHNIAINGLSSACDLADGSPICNLGV
jgi:hypothetical protein